MRKTSNLNANKNLNETVSTESLMALLDSGRSSAVKIGEAAGAKITIGRRVLWSLPKIRRYLESICE